jgi:hypothetical protein
LNDGKSDCRCICGKAYGREDSETKLTNIKTRKVEPEAEGD